VLLKVFRDLADLNEGSLSPELATAWKARPETRREYIRALLATQTGFRRGLLFGFLAGFALTGIFGALLAMHWLVVMQ
jgi:hypothetical protein